MQLSIALTWLLLPSRVHMLSRLRRCIMKCVLRRAATNVYKSHIPAWSSYYGGYVRPHSFIYTPLRSVELLARCILLASTYVCTQKGLGNSSVIAFQTSIICPRRVADALAD